MFIVQEVWYITKGMHTRKRSYSIVYFIDTSNRSRSIVMVADTEYDYLYLQSIYAKGAVELVGVEVTPAQFKYFEARRNELLGADKKARR